jgi:hypothetical protein
MKTATAWGPSGEAYLPGTTSIPASTRSTFGRASLHKGRATLDPIGSCQASTPQLGSKSRPLRQTPQTMLSALRMQWPSAFILDLPAARFRA